ncbi:hypothetical protein VNI00_002056 [Paramarasmius palmivorus]|uniref:F-box domain-containing protein n=1 Tax=Paramarasmius palmivorus TaxID=297713 RepID=A0AAW0E6Y2_9AGAR
MKKRGERSTGSTRSTRSSRKRAKHAQDPEVAEPTTPYIHQSSKLVNLSPELLEIIFLECFRADTHGHAFSKNAVPWIVTQVCRRWRQVALATSSLWSIIRIETGRLLAPKEPLKMLQAYLDRSQPMHISCMLDLGWDRTTEGKGHGRKLNNQIVKLLIAHSKRWYDMEITIMRSGSRLWAEFQALKGMPELRSLSLHGNMIEAYCKPEKLKEIAGMFLGASHLREARINIELPLFYQSRIMSSDKDDFSDEDGLPSGTPLLVLPWSQLRELTLADVYTQSLLRILPFLVNLEYLDAYVEVDWGVKDVSNDRIVHSKLRYLSLTGRDNTDIQTFTSKVMVPAIEDLRIGRPTYYSMAGVRGADRSERLSEPPIHLSSVVAHYVAHAEGKIRLLDTDMSTLSIPDFPKVLRSLHSVEEVHLRRASSKDIHTLLNLQNGMCPNLKSLRLIFEDDSYCDVEFLKGLVEMVKARSSGLQRLSFCVTRRGKPVEAPILLDKGGERLFQQLLILGQGSLDLCGNLVDKKWFSTDRDDHWTMARKERRSTRFGNTSRAEADHLMDWFPEGEEEEDEETESDTDTDLG